MKLDIYGKGNASPVASHYIKDGIQESESGKFLQFTTVAGKRIITNMDFIAYDEEEEEQL